MPDIWQGIDLFDVDKSRVERSGPIVKTDKSGFFYCRCGCLSLACGERAYALHAGDIYIYPPFARIYIRSMSEDLDGVVGLAGFDFIIPTAGTVTDTHSRLYIWENPCISLDQRQRIRLEELISAIRTRTCAQDASTVPMQGGIVYNELVLALARALCYEIMHAYFTHCPVQPLAQDRKDRIFQQFIFSLHRNFRREHSVQFYAAEQCFSPRYFSSVVREKSGRTALEWIVLVVTQEAKQLLADPSLSVKQVADLLGFPNQSFFGRYFRQYAGDSPARFRQHLLHRD